MAREQLGTLTISVDLTTSGQERAAADRGETATLTRLLELFDLYDVPATWAAPDPAKAALRDRILAAEVGHEFAILGDAAWVGATAGRRCFATELAHRTVAARSAGLAIASLVVQDAVVPREHYDLLIKHNITVVRQPRRAANRWLADDQPRPLRHGVWETPPSIVMPRSGAFARHAKLWGHGAGAVRSVTQRAVKLSCLAHLALDAGRLTREDPRLQAVENVLRFVARRCGRGALRTATLAPLAREWSSPARTFPARSILRAA